ncbi:DUF2993 domain-containing protein [Phormidium sp. LEGE 05292]|uniref:LmeA family phospholipid-binding protein n=1 Tax=[Phormidium] sp. LEGE 05292 TaxID=767427 RepID=UPI00187E9970|nr:DUF2993 domain-containing protein [Phormidium sp. LEGE 05292]MBE9228460.1 DUF2993 domain-containing protein [Phormidium sp. LEGE 05292]
MEFVTIFLSALLGVLGSVGIFVDRFAENAIRQRFQKVEQLQVRIDNAPNYQLIGGKVQRVRVAGRGLWLTPEARIAVLELDTDPVNVDLQGLRGGKVSPLAALRQPAKAAFRLVLTQEDVNNLLKSPKISQQLQELSSRFLGNMGGQQIQAYEIINPRIEFLPENRLRFQVELQQKEGTGTEQSNTEQKLAVIAESGLRIVNGHQLELISPAVSINENTIPEFLISALAQNFIDELDLKKLEKSGITARILDFQVNQDKLEIATFVQVQPQAQSQVKPKE